MKNFLELLWEILPALIVCCPIVFTLIMDELEKLTGKKRKSMLDQIPCDCGFRFRLSRPDFSKYRIKW